MKVTRAGREDCHGGVMTLGGSVARDKRTSPGTGYRNCSRRGKSVFRGVRAHNEPIECLQIILTLPGSSSHAEAMSPSTVQPGSSFDSSPCLPWLIWRPVLQDLPSPYQNCPIQPLRYPGP